MSPDNFEKRIQHQPLRQVPPEWREEVLSAAMAASASRRASPVARHLGWWRELFWPHPVAWAGLAAIWLGILSLTFATGEKDQPVARTSSPPSPEMIAILKDQERLFAELMGSTAATTTEADRLRTVTPRPRSEQRDETRAA